MPAHTTRPWRRPEPSWVFAGAAALRQLLLGSLWRCPILIFISRINLRSWFPLLPLLLLFLPGLEGESEHFSEELGTIYIHSWHEPAALQHQAQPSLRGLALARGVRDRGTSPDPPRHPRLSPSSPLEGAALFLSPRSFRKAKGTAGRGAGCSQRCSAPAVPRGILASGFALQPLGRLQTWGFWPNDSQSAPGMGPELGGKSISKSCRSWSFM